MGFKEEYIITNWIGKIIKYQDKELVIADEIEYEGVKYLYGITKDSVYTDDVKVTFLHRVDGKIFAHVTEPKIYKALVEKLNGNYMIDEVKKALDKKNNK